MKLNTGYRPAVHLPEHKVFRSGNELGGVVSNPGGQWLLTVPPAVQQQNLGGFETDACTSWGTLDAIETYAREVYDDITYWSRRYLAETSGTTPGSGNDPMTVFQTLQNKGVVPDGEWPYTAAMNSDALFYAVPPSSLATKALEYPAQYAVSSEWVTNDPQSLMGALEYSPLGIAGYAWELDVATGLYVTPAGAPPCHFFSLVGYVNGNYWIIFDSYENDIKHLAWDYVFSDAIRYSVTRNVVNQSAWQAFVNFMASWLGW